MKLISVLIVLLSSVSVSAFTISDYNSKLPIWGVSWKSGSGAISGYYPTFYTGFAVRSEIPERIHVRVSRGNQTRVSVILDDQTVMDYLYDLKKRKDFYSDLLKTGMVRMAPESTPQVEYFQQIVESPNYGIQETALQSMEGPALYKKSLDVLKALNPGRVFELDVDLSQSFSQWKQKVQNGEINASTNKDVVVALDTLVWGRVNMTEAPSSALLSALETAVGLAKSGSDEAYVQSALNLFKLATADKYNFKVLGSDGKWEDAIQCSSASNCHLKYPEFTTIYPTGSHKSFTSDGRGNSIPQFATPGLWQFLDRSYHDVDNIRSEPYYGWAPKMDYEEAGNGFHNPAVRFGGISDSVKRSLGIDSSHNTLWSVKRGGVSHGCLRLPLGHVWEMRHILPVENDKMKKVYFFGSAPKDFDLYDIDGDGTLEVMGVEYLISYGLKGEGQLTRREGSNLEIANGGKLDFYTRLYGSKGVFTSEVVTQSGKESLQMLFTNPSVSYPSYLDFKKKKVVTTQEVKGQYPLFEQSYERDKVQFYLPPTMDGLTSKGSKPYSKRFVRLMGRVKGCAPSADKATCGELAFDQEAETILKQAR